MALMRRLLLIGLLLCVPVQQLFGAIGGFIPPASGGGGGATLTFNNLVNTSGSTVSTIVSPITGFQAVQGDFTLTSGHWPKFVRDDTSAACVYSYGMLRTWSDGSLKSMSVVVRCPSTIAGSATLKVDVQTGGNQPTQGSGLAGQARTLAEICGGSCSSPTAADTVQMIAVGAATYGNMTNTSPWTAVLADAVNTGVCKKWIDGDAGTGWICDGDYKQSGVAHGQLRARWYTFSTTDGSGGYGGLRYLTRTWQPYYDIDSPTKAMRAFSSLTTCTGVTSTTCSGGTSTAVPFPYSPVNFTWQGSVGACAPASDGQNCFTATGNNFYTGVSQDANVVPVVASNSGGALPTGLSANTVYYATSENGTSTVSLMQGPSVVAQSQDATGNCSGTCTLTPVLNIQHFGSIFNATATTGGQTTSGGEATWRYFQGPGSMSADATLRATRDTTYWLLTKVLPPYTQGLNAPVATFSYDWNPFNVGPLTTSLEEPGARADIGPLPAQVPSHIFSQDANGEKVIRTMGLGSANFNLAMRQGAGGTFAPPNLGDPGNTYAGFTAGQYWNNFQYSQCNTTGNAFPVGNQPPVSQSTVWSCNNFSHMPSLAYYAYVWSGEPQYLDLLNEEAGSAISEQPENTDYGRNPLSPYSLATQNYAIVSSFAAGNIREIAWCLRAVVQAAGINPDTSPEGIDWKTYYSDIASASIAYMNMVTATVNSYWSTNGYWSAFRFAPSYSDPSNSVWQVGYMILVVNWAEALLESSAATTFVNNRLTWYGHVAATWGYYQITGYYEMSGNDDAGNPITSDDQWANGFSLAALTWTNAAPGVFTVTPGVNTAYVPHFGDKYRFTDAGYPLGSGNFPSGLSPYTSYFLCNVAGSGPYTANLMASAPGSNTCSSPLSVTVAGSMNNNTFTFTTAAIQPSTGSPFGLYYEEGVLAEFYAEALWAVANGHSGFAAFVTDSNTRLTAAGQYNNTTSTTCQFCMQSSY